MSASVPDLTAVKYACTCSYSLLVVLLIACSFHGCQVNHKNDNILITCNIMVQHRGESRLVVFGNETCTRIVIAPELCHCLALSYFVAFSVIVLIRALPELNILIGKYTLYIYMLVSLKYQYMWL